MGLEHKERENQIAEIATYFGERRKKNVEDMDIVRTRLESTCCRPYTSLGLSWNAVQVGSEFVCDVASR